MNKFMKKMWEKKDSKKGFTLVELIVVLVILAILAAIMIPAMVGWIDKAHEKQALIECRTYYLAAQTLASEQYAENPKAGTVDADKALELAFGTTSGYAGGEIKVAKGVVTTIKGFEPSNKVAYNYDSASGWEKTAD